MAVVLSMLISMAAMTAGASGAPAGSADELEMYRATVNATTLQTLQRGGYDVASVRETAGGNEVALVLTGAERERLRGQGVRLEVYRDKQGRTQRQRAEVQAAAGFTVWRSYDEAGASATRCTSSPAATRSSSSR
jgi:hypothetical protein